MLKKTSTVIKTRERRGLIVMICAKIGLFLVFLFIALGTAHSTRETLWYVILCGGALAILLATLQLIGNNRLTDAVGYLQLVPDIAAISVLPFLWYLSLNDPAVSRAFLLKTALPPVVYILLVFNSFSLKAELPLVLAFAAAAFQSFLYFHALGDPRVVVTDDFNATVTGPAVHAVSYFTNILFTLLAGVLLFLIARGSRKMVCESASNEVAIAQLSRYFSPNVVETIIGEASLLKPGGTQQNVAVLFSDIRGFTAWCDRHTPAEVLKLLTGYQEFMVCEIFAHGGTLDKYIGDGIMATFGTPLATDDDASGAVRAALAMRERLEAFNAARLDRGEDPVRHGIGIHYGPVIVGNIGAPARLEYTVIGDTVNIASRIEGMCKTLRHDILISQGVRDRLPAELRAATATAGETTLRGSKKPVELFAVSALS